MTRWLLRYSPWRALAQLFLLLVAMNAFVFGLGAIVRGAEMSAFLPAAIPAVLLGWWLAHSRVKPWLALGGLGLLGALLLWGRTAQLAGSLLLLVVSLPGFLLQTLSYTRGSGQPADSAALQQAIQNLLSQSGAVWGRLIAWLAALWAGTGAQIHDPVVRILVWSLLLWLLAVWAGWATAKGKVLAGLAPGLLLLAAVTRYTDADLTAVWIMAGSMLAMLSLSRLDANLRRWNSSGLDYAEMITGNTVLAGLVTVTLVAALGWVVSMVSLHDLLEALRHRQQGTQNQVALSLGLDAARMTAVPTPSAFAALRPASLPNNHLLGSGPELSKDVVFTVRTGELPAIPVADLAQIAPRHYWRSYTFDIYTGSGWVSSQTQTLGYAADQALYQAPAGYRLLQQDFSLRHGEDGSLYWSGALYSSTLPFEAAWRFPPGERYPQAVDPFRGADLYGALNSSATYRVQSLLRDISVEELRLAGRDTPDFIQQRYTRLPSYLPERVYALARDLTSSAATPYDEVMAIQTYLRANYAYSLDVPPPPSGVDVADTFLFELKRGYCDYYATAMVVMLRSVGLPSRLVMGFAPGTYNALAAEYVVTAADAHSWVEVYFPGLGWVEFEPTAARPEIIRPQQPLKDARVVVSPEAQWDKIVRSMYSVPQTARQVLFGLGLLLALVAAFFLLEGWLLGFVSPQFALRWMYRSIYRQGRRLVNAPIPGQTTSEFVDSLQRVLTPPDVRLDVLTGIYLQGLFGSQPVQKAQIRVAVRAWRGLRWRLLWARKKKVLKSKPKRG